MKDRRPPPPKMPPLGSGRYRLTPEFLFGVLVRDQKRRDEELRDPVAHRKRIAAAIDLEIVGRADELGKQGVSNPVIQAKEEVAKQWGHASVETLDRWLRRNR